MDDQFSISDSGQLKDFQCSICQKYFSRKFTLDMHLLIHKGVKPHPCPFCDKSFRQKGTLMRHKALHSVNNLFHCSLCDRGFRQKNVFLHHLKHRHSVSTETLDRRKYRTELKDYQSIMDTLPPFVLADSTAIASSEKHLDAMLFETMSSGICDSSVTEGSLQGNCFDNQTRLPQDDLGDWGNTNGNVSNGKANEVISYKCDLCLIFFNDYNKYKQHVEEQHSDSDMLLDSKPIICPYQSESNTSNSIDFPVDNSNVLLSNNNSMSHISVTNNSLMAKPTTVSSSNDSECNENMNLCIPCQQSFANEDEFECHLKTHVQSVLGKSDATSDRNCNQFNSYSMHIKSNCETPPSNSDGSFNFTSMNKSNISSSSINPKSLDQSQLNITPFLKKSHVDSSEYVAKGKNLLSKVQLLKNKALNTAYNNDFGAMSDSIPLYKCKVCNKMFQKRVALEYHKQMHMNTRGFDCDYCKNKFKSKQLLLSHTRSTHMKTFKCISCSRLFNYRSIYIYHKKKCFKNVNLEMGSKSSFNLPLIDMEKLLSSDVSGIAGVIPICDENVSKNSVFKYGIPVVSLEAVRNFSSMPFLNTLEIKGSLK